MKFDRTTLLITVGLIGLIVAPGPILSAQIYQSRADTGRMVWGHKDYTRHTGAGYCDRARAEVLADQARAYIPDTSAASPTQTLPDTIAHAVIAAARACADRFTVEGTDPRELWGLARIQFVLGNDVQAKAAIDRMISLQSTPDARAVAMHTAVFLLTGATPVRLAMVGEYLTRLEGLGAPGLAKLMSAHGLVARHWIRQYKKDSIMFHARKMITVWKTMPRKEQDEAPIIFAYEYLLNIANDEEDLSTQEKIIAQAEADGIGAWRDGAGDNWLGGWISVIERRKAVYGKKTRPLDGTFWINHQGVPQPAPGHLSIIIRLGSACGWECHKLYEMIRSFHTKYGTDLVVTLITETQGWLPGSGPLTPTEEVQGVAEHFLKFLRLPVVVMVDELPVDTLSDGRLQRDPKKSRLSDIFPGGGMTNCMIVDRDGKVRWLGGLQFNEYDRRTLDFVLGRASQVNTNPKALGASLGTRE